MSLTYTTASTTPTPSTTTATITESNLIYRVKEAADSDALTALVNSHTGIYCEIINRYAQVYPNAIKRDDLIDDRLFNIYRFILDYDPTKGCKLPTYIGDRTDYMCKTLLKQDRNNPITAGTYGLGGPLDLGTSGDTYTTASGASVTLVDGSKEAQVVDVADSELKMEEIQAAAWSLCPDTRFVEILGYRHLNSPKTCLSWREIGKRMGLSHERARLIYNENIEIVSKHLREKAA